MPDLDEMPESETRSQGPTPDEAPCSDWNPLKEDLESWTDMLKWVERRQQQKKIAELPRHYEATALRRAAGWQERDREHF